MLEIVWNKRSRVFRRRNLFREAAETVDQTDPFLRVAKRLFEPTLRDLAGRERVIGRPRKAYRGVSLPKLKSSSWYEAAARSFKIRSEKQPKARRGE